MTYRDDLDATSARADALQTDLDREKQDNDRLRAELARAAQPKSAPAKSKPSAKPKHARRAKNEKQAEPVPTSDPSLLDVGANDACFRLGASGMSFGFSLGFYTLWLPFTWPMVRLVGALFKFKGAAAFVFAIPLMLNIVIGVIGMLVTSAAVVHERHWPTTLPFSLFGYRGLFDRTRPATERNSFQAIVFFADGVAPPTSLVAESMFDGVLVSNIELHERSMTLSCGMPVTSMNWLAFRRLRNGVHSIADSLSNWQDAHRVTRVELVQA